MAQGNLAEMRAVLTGLARELDPSALPLTEAKAMLGELVTIKNIAAALEGRLGRRISEGREWERAGFASAEAWLAQQTGTPLGKARETLETALRLDELPALAEAAHAGKLSAEQTAVIADAATADPSAQRRLVESARSKPLSKLRDECAAIKRAADPDPEAAHRRLHAARQLRFSRALDGAARMFGATTPDQMAVVKAAVQRRGDELFDQARQARRHEPREAFLMDALAQICHEWLTGQAASPLDQRTRSGPAENGRGGAVRPGRGVFDPEGAFPAPPSTSATPISRPRPKRPGYIGLLRLDLEALQRGHAQGDELCEIAGLGAIPVSVARRLLGDAVLKLVLTRGVDVANVTHLGRGPTAAQKIAMLWSSPGCAVTSCARMAGIEHDHRVDWAHTRHTVLDELNRLCDHHHDLKTHRGWALVTGPSGVTEMVAPHDARHPGRLHPRAGEPTPPDGPDPPPGRDRSSWSGTDAPALTSADGEPSAVERNPRAARSPDGIDSPCHAHGEPSQVTGTLRMCAL